MTTYSDIHQRLFYDRDKVAKQRLRRKRSCGRLKQYNSEQDLRSWGNSQDERRRHILELMSGLKTLWGNYVPFEVLFAQLALISAGKHESGAVSGDPSDKRTVRPTDKPSTDKLPTDKPTTEPLGEAPKKPATDGKKSPGGPQPQEFSRQSRSRTKPDSSGAPISAFKAIELEAQKEDLSGLVKALSKDANDLRRDSASIKSENETLRGSVDALEDEVKQLKDQLKEAQDANEAKDNLENELRKEKEELENERRLSQQLEDERNEAEQKAADLEQQLEDERRKSAVIQEQLQNDLEREKRKSSVAKDAADRLKNELEEERSQGKSLKSEPPSSIDDERRASKELNDKLQKELEDERRRSDAAREAARKLEKRLEDACKKDADDALEEKSALRRALKMEQCLRNEISSLEDENDCLRKEVDRLRMVECELADCEIKVQDLLCEVESYKCCLERQEYENQKMSCVIKEQQDLIFNLQDVVTSNKSNENLQSESWASCNESMVDYQCQIEDLNSTVAKQKCLISSQGECLQRQHNYITQLEQIRCKLQSQVEGYKNEIKEAKAEVDSLCRKRKQLQQELDYLTTKLQNYLERIQGLEKSQLLNSKPACQRQSSPMRSDRGSISSYSTYSRDVCPGSSTSNRCSSLQQPEQDFPGRSSLTAQDYPGRSSLTGNRESACRSRSCQPGPSNKRFR